MGIVEVEVEERKVGLRGGGGEKVKEETEERRRKKSMMTRLIVERKVKGKFKSTGRYG